MELEPIRDIVKEMAILAYNMLEKTYKGFMEHDRDILSEVLKDDDRLNELEKKVDIAVAGVSQREKISSADKNTLIILANMAGDLEAIGDYCKDMIERIEIKIEEKLLFSEEAVAEYQHLYEAVKTALGQVANALKMNDYKFIDGLLCAGNHVEELVDKYRQSHTQRLLQGVCTPMGCNMFLNLLDFTAAIYNHTKKTAVGLKKIGK